MYCVGSVCDLVCRDEGYTIESAMAIYDAYYGCKLEPFSLNPDPRFLYMTPRHQEALAQLRYVTMERRGFAVLTGEVGTGKTTIIRKIIEEVDKGVTTAYIFNPPRSLDELKESVSRELGLGWKAPQPFISCLNEFLLDSIRHDRVVLVIFDEVQALPIDILEEIRLLSNIETASAKLLQIVLAGQPEFDVMLDSVELRALRQRVAMRCSLEPMHSEETAEYIGRRLRVAGARRSPFTFEACSLIHKYSDGIPRLINSICDSAMIIGYASDAPVIEKSTVEQAVRDLGLKKDAGSSSASREQDEEKVARPFRRVASYAAVGVAVVAAVLLWITVGGVEPQFYAQPRAFLQQAYSEAYSFVTRMVDLPVNGAGRGGAGTADASGQGSDASVWQTAPETGQRTTGEVADRSGGARNEQALRSTTQGGTRRETSQELGRAQ